MSKLVPVIWRKGAGKIIDEKGERVRGGEVGYFSPKRAENFVLNTLAEWPDEDSDGNDGLRSDGGGGDVEAVDLESDHSSDDAVDE